MLITKPKVHIFLSLYFLSKPLHSVFKMKKSIFLTIICVSLLLPKTGEAQVNEDQLGAWYMYFFNTTFKESSWGVQGDIQYRNWNIAGDLQQLLLRGGITYTPKNADIKLTIGYGNITIGSFGVNNKSTLLENRIYQEAVFPMQFGNRVYTKHRFRYEQRFVEGQNFRTRYRYNLFLNIPLSKPSMDEKTLYLAFYNELFINGQKNIGNGDTVEFFALNRLYGALGYILKKALKIQLGVMNQTTNSLSKKQLQLSFHQKF